MASKKRSNNFMFIFDISITITQYTKYPGNWCEFFSKSCKLLLYTRSGYCKVFCFEFFNTIKKSKRAAILSAVLCVLLINETECRTRLVMGRKTITRTYYKEPPIPAWATVTLVGLGILLMGGVLYVVLHKIYLYDEKNYTDYSVTNTEDMPA